MTQYWHNANTTPGEVTPLLALVMQCNFKGGLEMIECCYRLDTMPWQASCKDHAMPLWR